VAHCRIRGLAELLGLDFFMRIGSRILRGLERKKRAGEPNSVAALKMDIVSEKGN
jgi:hypothetical protein